MSLPWNLNGQKSGIQSVNSGPLIIRTYNDSSDNNTYVLGTNDINISSNYVLTTSTGGVLVPTDTVRVSSVISNMGVFSTLTASTINGTNTSLPTSFSTLTGSTITANNAFFSTITGSTITGSTITASTIRISSTMISLGASTNQTYTGLSYGNYSASAPWISSLSSLTAINTVSMSANAQYQLVVTSANTISSVYLTSNYGQTWSSISGVSGLPTSLTTSYSCGAISATGQYGILATTAGYSYVTSDYFTSFTATNPSSSDTPYIYLPFEQSLTDQMGHTIISTPHSVPDYRQGIIGSYAVNLNNSPGLSFASYLLRGTWTPGNVFAISFWVNIQSTINGYKQFIVGAFGNVGNYNGFGICLNETNNISVIMANNIISSTSYTITTNTWYKIGVSYQSNSIGYFYVNDILIGSFTCPASLGTSSGYFSLGGRDTTNGEYSFNGYIDDFKLYNTSIYNYPNIRLLPYNTVAVSGNGQYMIASVTGGGIYMSSTNGAAWYIVSGLPTQNTLWGKISVAYTGKYIIIIAKPDVLNSSSGAYYSTDFGTTWTQSVTTLFSASISGNALYATGGALGSMFLYNNRYLSQYGSVAYTVAICSPPISGNGFINVTNIMSSYIGKHIVFTTNDTASANVYYSIDYGANFTGIQFGNTQSISCAISYDGSYIIVANSTTVYTLNINSNGYSISIGNQAGQINQGQNAIAIGNQAGKINQSANSIILNASGSTLTSYYPGCYISPVGQYTTSSSDSFSLLGYGNDNQIIQGLGTLSYTNNIYIGLNITASSSVVSNEIVLGSTVTGNGANTVTLGNTSSTAGIYIYGILRPAYTTLIAPTATQIGYTISATIAANSGTTSSNFAPLTITVGVWLITFLVTFTSMNTFPNSVITIVGGPATSYPILTTVTANTGVGMGTYTYNSTGTVTLGLSVATTANSPITGASSYYTATRIA